LLTKHSFIKQAKTNLQVVIISFDYRGFPEVRPGPLIGKKTNWENKTWTK